MAEPRRFTQAEMTVTAARALGKIDRDGLRGVTRVSADEIAAMAGMLALFGLVPIAPDATEIPTTLIIKPEVSND